MLGETTHELAYSVLNFIIFWTKFVVTDPHNDVFEVFINYYLDILNFFMLDSLYAPSLFSF